jgi:hypothetical protein
MQAGLRRSPALCLPQVHVLSRPWSYITGRRCPIGRSKWGESQGLAQCAGRVRSTLPLDLRPRFPVSAGHSTSTLLMGPA